MVPEILNTVGAACQMVAGVASVIWLVLEIARQKRMKIPDLSREEEDQRGGDL